MSAAPDDSQRLSRIATLWTVVRQAHEPADRDALEEAQHALMERYCTSVHRYLLGALRDEEAADELFQEFALRFLRGDLRRTDAKRGRFRDYLRTTLINLVNDHHRRRAQADRPLPIDVAATTPAEGSSEASSDGSDAFIATWRSELMNHAWAALERTQPSYHAVLLYHVQNPTAESAQAAEALSPRLGKTITKANLRVMLHRARERFGELLLSEVVRSLQSPTDEELAGELKDLNLSKPCAAALKKRLERNAARAEAST
jgi:RNA polymerase sigma-70 factor (ECF subfamily)